SQIAQYSYATLRDDLARDFMHRGQHSTDSGWNSLIGHRTVRDGEVRLFQKSVSIDHQQDVVIPCCRTAVKGSVDQGADNIPDFRPAYICRLAQDFLRMFCSGNRTIGIVVKLNVARSPPQNMREAIRNEDT